MATEKRPSSRPDPDDDLPTDAWDDLLDDDSFEDAMDDDIAPPASKPSSDPTPAPEDAPKEKPKPRSKPAPIEIKKPQRKPAPAAQSETTAPERKRRREKPADSPDARGKSKDTDKDSNVERPTKRVRQQKENPDKEPRRRQASPKDSSKAKSEEPTFRPEEIEGAERTKDGLIKVREDAEKNAPAKKSKEKASEKQPWLKSLGLVDYIGLAASLAIFIGLAGMLLSWMYGEEWGSHLDRPDPEPDVPVAGQLFKLTEAESYWRRRVSTDRAPATEIIIPEVTVDVEPVGTNGFLSVFFRDPEGKMSADAGNIELKGGQLSVNSNEGRQDGANRFTFTSTRGFVYETEFRSYLSLPQDSRWSVEVVETSDFSGGESKRLAYFEIASDARTREDKPDAAPAE